MQRNTRQREAILRVLADATGPLTPQEIREIAHAKCPGIGIATVYRMLKNLQEEGRAAIVEIPGTAPRYEDSAREHHHHFFCKTCGKAFELARCLPEVDRLAPDRFRVESHDIILYGTCAACGPSAT